MKQNETNIKMSQSRAKHFWIEMNNNSFVIPGFRENGQDNGRPQGGLAQLSINSLDIKKYRLKSENFRVMGQILDLPIRDSQISKLLYICAYFPTDDQSINGNIDKLSEIQG